MSEALNSVIGFFERGGLFMWPLLICSVVALTTIILRGFALREKYVMPLVIESEIERLMPGGSADRTEPAALEWVRRWGPGRLTASPLDCSCEQGRCAVCN